MKSHTKQDAAMDMGHRPTGSRNAAQAGHAPRIATVDLARRSALECYQQMADNSPRMVQLKQQSEKIVQKAPAQAPLQFTREWATGKVDKEIDDVAKKTGNSDVDTGHHKASKSAVMERIFGAMTTGQWEKMIAVLDLEPGSGVNALKSLGSNLTLGPNSGKREDEGGRNFDPNKTGSGALTPRSGQYEDLIDFMNARESPGEKFSRSEFEEVLRIIEFAEKIHYQKTRGEIIDGDLSMWEQGNFSDGKTWRKKGADGYTVDTDSLADRSVRDLKGARHRATLPKPQAPVHKILPKIAWSSVTRFSTPMDQESLDRWKADGFTRFYRISDKSCYFLDREEAAKVFLKDPDFVLNHFPDTKESERELYGFELLRPKFKDAD